MTAMKIKHSRGSYEIRFGSVTDKLAPWLDSLGYSQRLVVTDRNVAANHLPEFRKALLNGSDCDLPVVILEPGDEHKNFQELQKIWNALADHQMRRDGLLVAFGGGVVGDMAGFAAASWMRGIDFFQVPTTLLAQVDASVGGKTAINHAAGKNLVGAFHQPAGVLIDSALLLTLSEREFRAGIAEILKAALLKGEQALDSFEADLEGLLGRDPAAIQRQVSAAVELKAQLVEADEQEHGKRAWLNLGHTFGHAIENALGYGNWLHGEAVAAGMVAACTVSERSQGLDPAVTVRVISLLRRAELPWQLPVEVPVRQLISLMSLDKKATRDGVRLVLLAAPGEPLVTTLGPGEDLAGMLSGSSH